MEKNKKRQVPHTYVIIFFVMILAAFFTYIIPAGEYKRVEDQHTGRTVVDPNSFSFVKQNPTSFFNFMKSIPKGMKESSSITFFLFIIAGSFSLIDNTGAIRASIGKLASKLQNKSKLFIPVFILIFAILGGTIGLSEEVLIFIPIGIALSRALGFDAIVGTAIISLGAGCGFSSGFMNPFTVGVAQGIAELPLFSGIELRLIVLAVMIIVTTLYILQYANKIKKNPQLSIVYELEQEEKEIQKNKQSYTDKITKQQITIILTFFIGLGMIVYGVLKYGWYITELAAAFLVIGIICGIINRNTLNEIAEQFVEGARTIVFGALVVGLARGILVIMQDGMILDSMIYYLSNIISRLHHNVSVIAMYIVQIIINFFIPSGSGQAAVTMPIMAPLGDVMNVNRQIIVLAFQFGDGFTNSIIPTSGALMAGLSVANISYDKWVKFVWPLMCIWISIGAVFLIIANLINYGPF